MVINYTVELVNGGYRVTANSNDGLMGIAARMPASAVCRERDEVVALLNERLAEDIERYVPHGVSAPSLLEKAA